MKSVIDTELLIGGPADGQRRHVLHGNRIQVMTDAGLADYRAERIEGEHVTFKVWVHQPIPIDEVLNRLFEGYAPKLPA